MKTSLSFVLASMVLLTVGLWSPPSARADLLAGWTKLNASTAPSNAPATTNHALLSATMNYKNRFYTYNDNSWFYIEPWHTNKLIDGVSATNKVWIGTTLRTLTNYIEYNFIVSNGYKVTLTNFLQTCLNDERKLVFNMRSSLDDYTSNAWEKTTFLDRTLSTNTVQYTTNRFYLYTNVFSSRLRDITNSTFKMRMYGEQGQSQWVYSYWTNMYKAGGNSTGPYTNYMMVFEGTVDPMFILTPNQGPYAGGNIVTTTNAPELPAIGNGTDITNVLLGGVAVTSILGQGTNWVQFVVPPASSSGLKDVAVLSTSAGSNFYDRVYTYNPAGQISSVDPPNGVPAGGYPVTINGSNLGNGTDITNVTLAGVAAAVTSQSATQVVVTAGAGSSGNGDVRVFSTSFGETILAGGFTYDTVVFDSTTVVAGSPNPSGWGESVTFTATVTRASGSETPSGTVTFKEGGTTLGTGNLSGSGASAMATFGTGALTVGAHTITAEYGGDSHFNRSTNSVAQTVNTATEWAGGGSYDWIINDATGTAGADPGWSWLIASNLNITATSDNKYTLQVTTHAGSVPGAMAHFDNAAFYAWKIATAAGGIVGFAPEKFVIGASGVANDLGGGTLALSISGNDLQLCFNPAANQAPVANSNTLATPLNTPATINASRLLANDTDTDGGVLALTGVSRGSVSGGAVTLNANRVTYTPTADYVGSDWFTYSIADGHGGVATGAVVVMVTAGTSQIQSVAYSAGGVTMQFAGVPGWSYKVQRATSVSGPWSDVHTTNAPATGVFTCTDSDPPSPIGYYRLMHGP